MHDPFEQRKSRGEVRRTSVRPLELIEQSVAVEIGSQFALHYIEGIRILLQWQRERRIRAVPQNPVPVDPTFLGVLDVVVHDEYIYGRDELVIADIGQKVRLHDGHPTHPSLTRYKFDDGIDLLYG